MRKLPIITPFSPALTASGCSSPRFSTRPPQRRKSAAGRIRRKIAMNLTASQGSISSRSPNFVPARGLSRLIGTLVGSMLGQLEGHLDALLARLAEVEDAADARLEPGFPHRLDRADATLVPDRGGHLVVVAARRLDVVVHALDAGLLQLPRALGRHVADRGAALEVGVLRHQPRALEHLGEVALRQPLALGHHAEAVRPGRLGRARVLEDLLGLHHRVHRRLGVGVLRLGAEPAVLGASAALRVDERAHVGRLAEVVLAHAPGASTRRSMSAWAVSSPSSTASSKEISGGIRAQARQPGGRFYSYASASSTSSRDARRAGRDRRQHAGQDRQDGEHDQGHDRDRQDEALVLERDGRDDAQDEADHEPERRADQRGDHRLVAHDPPHQAAAACRSRASCRSRACARGSRARACSRSRTARRSPTATAARRSGTGTGRSCR